VEAEGLDGFRRRMCGEVTRSVGAAPKPVAIRTGKTAAFRLGAAVTANLVQQIDYMPLRGIGDLRREHRSSGLKQLRMLRQIPNAKKPAVAGGLFRISHRVEDVFRSWQTWQ
jgi:hypothetical protein